MQSKALIPYRISLCLSWQNMPVVLDRMRTIDLDVRKANVKTKESVLFIKETKNRPVSIRKLELLDTILSLSKKTNGAPATASIDLPKDTQIVLYNVSSNPFTTCEFTCDDRIGLLSDILTFFTHLSVDIKSGHVSTILDQAHNVFHITKRNGEALGHQEIMYISNVFEHEGKRVPIQCITPEY